MGMVHFCHVQHTRHQLPFHSGLCFLDVYTVNSSEDRVSPSRAEGRVAYYPVS